MAENAANIVRTSIRMRADLHKRLNDYVQKRKYTPEKTTIDAEVQNAVEAFLEEKRTATTGGTSDGSVPAENNVVKMQSGSGQSGENGDKIITHFPTEHHQKLAVYVEILDSQHPIANAVTSILQACLLVVRVCANERGEAILDDLGRGWAQQAFESIKEESRRIQAALAGSQGELRESDKASRKRRRRSGG